VSGQIVLIVVHKFTTRTALQAMLESAGYTVFSAGDGREAVETAALIQADIILSDVMMPEVDGFELCRQLQQEPGTRDIPVMLLAAPRDSTSMLKGFQMGAAGYIPQPFEREDVLSRVARTCRLSRQKQENPENLLDERETLEETSLIEFLRLCQEDRISATVRLTKAGSEGVIRLRAGEIATVRLQDDIDNDTLQRVLQWTWKDGYFTVEEEDSNRAEDEKGDTMTGSAKKPHILITDDENAIVESLMGLLELEYTVFAANSGEDALNIIKQQEGMIDVLITDVNMPGMNGLDLLVQARSVYPKLQVIVMTGYGSKEVSKTATERGALFYVQKPVSIKQLQEYVEQALDTRKAVGFRGEVQTLNLIDIVQMYCLGQIKAALTISRVQHGKEEKGVIYFENGQITNIVFDNRQPEHAFNYLISWKHGNFTTEYGESSPERTIHKSWEGMLLQATQVHDEGRTPTEQEGSEQSDDEELSEAFAGLEELAEISDSEEVSETSTYTKEVIPMATKTEGLKDVVQSIKSELSEAEHIAIVATDGTVFASNISGGESTKVGAMITTFMGLSKRTCKTLDKGEPTEALIKAGSGFIAIYPAGKATLGVTTLSDTNLAMLNMVCREAAEKIEDILG